MSALVIQPGALVVFDPSDIRVVVFDWDLRTLSANSQAASQTFTITRIQGSGTLTKDNPALLSAADATTAVGRTVSSDNRVSHVRLDATTTVLGDQFEVANKIVTNETPAQTKEQSFAVLIQNR